MIRDELVEEMKKIISPILTERDMLLVELNLFLTYHRTILKLLVDKQDGGISLDECAELNQKIGALLDEKDMIKSRYILEVSSPGLDRPLKTKEDFLRCINRKAKFFLKDPINSKIEWDGIISKIDKDKVCVDIDGEKLEFPLSKINKAKQII